MTIAKAYMAVTDKGKEFLAAVRGIPAHHVTKALNTYTPGINWARCTKQLMAEQIDYALHGKYGHKILLTIDLQQLARRARARMHAETRWQEVV
jgi:hypothetical protein